jgi:hypothetical protein
LHLLFLDSQRPRGQTVPSSAFRFPNTVGLLSESLHRIDIAKKQLSEILNVVFKILELQRVLMNLVVNQLDGDF